VPAAQVGTWAAEVLAGTPAPPDATAGIPGEGKTLWGSRKQGAPGVSLRSAVAHRVSVTLAQQAVADKTNAIPVVMELRRQVVIERWSSRVAPSPARLSSQGVMM